MAKLPGTNVALTFLEINGKGAGLIRDFKPPTYEVETINPGLAATGGVKRAFGSPKISKAVVTFPISQTGPLFDWAAAFMRKEVVETDLAIIMADQNYQARLRVDLLRCLITEIAFPPLEGGSKDPFEVTVTFQPNGIKYSKAGGKVDTSSMPKNKAWTISNFRLTTPGIDGKYVSRVDLPTLSLRISKESVGEVRPPERHTSWEIGGLKTEHSSLGFDAALDLVTRTLQDGVISESESMDISVDMYDASMATVIGTFTLTGCAPRKLAWSAEGVERMATAQVEFAVGDFAFEKREPAVGAPARTARARSRTSSRR